MSLRNLILAFSMLFMTASAALAQEWRWQLPPERYQQMSVFERAQYDKAALLFEQRDFDAAASEFEKFKVQYADSPNLSYMIFMNGLSLHQANKRITAIKMYNEVLDYFGDSVTDAAPALFYLGQAYQQNGEISDAISAYEDMVADAEYQKHPLAAGALRALADYHYAKEPEKSIQYWIQVVRSFEATAGTETRNARRNLLTHFIRGADYVGLESTLVRYEGQDPNRIEDPAFRKYIAQEAHDVAWNGFAGFWGKYNDLEREKKAADMEAYYNWFVTQKPYWDKGADTFAFYDRAISFQCYRLGKDEEITRLIDECVAFLQEVGKTNLDVVQAPYGRLVDLLRDCRRYERSRYVLTFLRDRNAAAWKEYEIRRHSGDWTATVAQLQEIEKNIPTLAAQALWERANIYKDVLGQHENAIKLYLQCNNPPQNLWQIQDAYKRMGALAKSLDTLTEIESSFPDNAARAAWFKTSYFDEAGDSQKAIQSAKRLLQAYPESPESSNAHQLLEKYGINAGGGVLDKG